MSDETPAAAPQTPAPETPPAPQAPDINARLDALQRSLEQQNAGLAALAATVRPPQAPADEPLPDLDPDVEKVVSSRLSQAMAPLNQRIQAISEYADAQEAQRLIAQTGATADEQRAIEQTYQALAQDPQARSMGLATRVFAVTHTLGRARIAAGPKAQTEAARLAANRGATVESPGAIPSAAAPESLPDAFSVFDSAALSKVATEAEKRLGYNAATGLGGALTRPG